MKAPSVPLFAVLAIVIVIVGGWLALEPAPAPNVAPLALPAQEPQETATGSPVRPEAPSLTPEPGSKVPRVRFPAAATLGQDGPIALVDLPASPLKSTLEALPPAARDHALRELARLRVPVSDLASLDADATGQLFYACRMQPPVDDDHPQASGAEPEVAGLGGQRLESGATAAAFAVDVPTASPPVRHSRRGSANVIYLDFNGHTVTGTAWNTAADAPAAYVCIPYDTDGNASTFSPAEQAFIVNVWERVAEDFRAFDVNVTTEAPTVFNNRTARVLFTRKSDANGIPNPSSATASGVAYLGVFGLGSYATTYSVSFVYPSTYSDGFVASVASHEVGHNLGLSHDGTLNADGSKDDEYYAGHGTGAASWSPIMGSGNGQTKQWSRGEYFRASNKQDDLVVMSGFIPRRGDDHADTGASATALHANGSSVQNRGVITGATDEDWFSIVTAGTISLTVTPTTASFASNRVALDVRAELHSVSGSLLATSDPADSPACVLEFSPGPGTYLLRVAGTGVGNPQSDPPSGYTAYGSIGEFTISGTVTAPTAPAAPAIVIQPENQSVYPGITAVFSVVATGNPSTSHQWQRSVDSGGSWQNLAEGTAHAGVGTATLSVAGVDATANGHRFRCVVSNAFGNATSASAMLTVQLPPPPVLPVFDGPPLPSFGRGVPAGTSQNLRYSLVEGTEPITYQWRRDGIDIPGANGLYYFDRNWQAADAGSYTVVATNAVGSAESAPYTQYLQPEGGWTWRNPRPTGNGTTRAAFLNGQFFVGGIRGTLLHSTDGLAWTTRTLPASNNLYGFQFINGLHVVLGSLGAVFSSPDGVIWTPRDTGTVHQDASVGLVSVATSGSRLMAVGSGGTYTTTTDGIHWTSGFIGTGDDLSGVEFAFGRFHAVSGTNGRVYSSTDGSAWTSVASPAGDLRRLAFGAGRLVAGGSGGVLLTSTDGTTWTPVSSGVTATILDVAHVNGRFFATGTSGTILTSTDGLQWTRANTFGNASSIQNVAFGNGRYIAPAQGGATGRALLTSTDGLNWNELTTGAGTVGWHLRAAAASPTSIVAVGSASSGNAMILQSGSGATWSSRATVSGRLDDVGFGNGLFLAMTNGGTVHISNNDGFNWNQYTLAAGESFNGIRHVNGLWFATGASGGVGRLRTSTTGLEGSWTSRISTGAALNKVAHGSSNYVAVGNSGTIWRSTNGTSWTAVSSGTTANLRDVAYGSGMFVAVGAGVVVTSPGSFLWTNRSFTPDTLTSVTYAGGHFIATAAAGPSGNASTYYVSADGIQWSGRFTGAVDVLNDIVAFDDEVYGVGDNSVVLSAGVPVLVAAGGSRAAVAGENITLEATATASPVPVTYQWHRDGVPVPGATQLRLPLSPARVADSGRYTLVATNTFGSATSAPIDLDVEATGFASWQEANFTPAQLAQPAVIAPGAVLTADGLPNLLKYALGLDPSVAATSGLPVVRNEDGAWTFTYTRPASATDVTYVVEIAESLPTWTSTGVEHDLVSEDAGIQTWRARFASGGERRVFVRLRVDL